MMTGVHGLSSADAVLMPAPLAHISGLLNAVLVPGAAAMRTVLMERWDVERGLSLIEKERISYMIGPPTMFTAADGGCRLRPGKVASLRVISSGMMGVTPAFIEAAQRRASGPSSSAVTGRPRHRRCPPAPTTIPRSGAGTPTAGRWATPVIRIADPVTGRARPGGAGGRGLDPGARAVRRLLRCRRDSGLHAPGLVPQR